MAINATQNQQKGPHLMRLFELIRQENMRALGLNETAQSSEAQMQDFCKMACASWR